MRRRALWQQAAAGALMLVPLAAAGQGNPFAGGWRAQTVLLGQAAWVELLMSPDGRFQQQTRTQAALITIMGTYRVLPEQSVLRLDIRDYEPKQWCGPLGCNPIRMPDGETHYFQFNGPNLLVLRPVAGGQAIQYQRSH